MIFKAISREVNLLLHLAIVVGDDCYFTLTSPSKPEEVIYISGHAAHDFSITPHGVKFRLHPDHLLYSQVMDLLHGDGFLVFNVLSTHQKDGGIYDVQVQMYSYAIHTILKDGRIAFNTLSAGLMDMTFVIGDEILEYLMFNDLLFRSSPFIFAIYRACRSVLSAPREYAYRYAVSVHSLLGFEDIGPDDVEELERIRRFSRMFVKFVEKKGWAE